MIAGLTTLFGAIITYLVTCFNKKTADLKRDIDEIPVK